jgi:hypothetical protein
MRGVDDADRRGPAPMVDENDLLGFTEVEPAVEPMVEPTPLPAPAPSEGPQLAWVMRVYNGAECRVLGWANLDDFQPLELSTQGPNIFQDKPGQPLPPMGGQGLEPRQPVSGSEPGAGALPTGDTSGDSGADADSEPEELFE